MEISGYAALYNVETVIAGLFREKLAPGAFTEAIKRDDVRALLNHNPDHVLGRKSAGTLTLSEDSKGLRYAVRLNPDDPFATSVGARISRRDITGSSFAFAIDNPETDEEWEPPTTRGGLPLRTLKRLRLVDVSPVTFPAYPTASVGAWDGRVAAQMAKVRVAIAKAKAWPYSRTGR